MPVPLPVHVHAHAPFSGILQDRPKGPTVPMPTAAGSGGQTNLPTVFKQRAPWLRSVTPYGQPLTRLGQLPTHKFAPVSRNICEKRPNQGRVASKFSQGAKLTMHTINAQSRQEHCSTSYRTPNGPPSMNQTGNTMPQMVQLLWINQGMLYSE